MGHTIQLQMPFEVMCCVSCGVPMALPAEFISHKRRLKGRIRCPRGHINQWSEEKSPGPTVEELQEQIEELKRERVQAIHEADQLAAAREAGKEPVTATETAAPAKRPRIQCPKCNKTYMKFGSAMRSHLIYEHGMKPNEAVQEVDTAQKAFVTKANPKNGES